jgi:hypothetical protein
VEAPEFRTISELERVVPVGAAESEPAELEAPGATEAPELGDPDCKALRKEVSAELAVTDADRPPEVAETVGTRLENELDVGTPAVGAPEAAEFPGALGRPEPGAPMVLTIVWTEVVAEVATRGA